MNFSRVHVERNRECDGERVYATVDRLQNFIRVVFVLCIRLSELFIPAIYLRNLGILSPVVVNCDENLCSYVTRH